MAQSLKSESIAGSLRIVMALTILQRCLALVRQAVFTRLLGPASFGALGLAMDAILGTPLNTVTLGIPSSYSRYIQQYERRGRLRDFYARTLRSTIWLAPLATVLLLIGAPWVSRWIFKTPARAWLVALAALSVVPEALARHLRAGFAGMRMFKLSSAMDFLPVATFSLLGVVLVLFVSRTAEAAAIAQTAASWLTLLVFGFILARHLKAVEPVHEPITEPGFNAKILKFSVWSFFAPLAMHVLTLVDRTMLARMRTLTDVGIYNTASNVSDYVFLFGALTANVLSPNMSRMWEEGDHALVQRRINFALRATLLVLLGVALFLLGVSPKVIPLICGPAYQASAQLMWVFVIYQLLFSAFYVIGLYAILVEKPRMNLFAVLVGLGVNVTLNLHWIPAYGTMGAALAALASMVAMVVMLLLQCMFAGFRFELRSLLVVALLFLPALQHRAVLLWSYIALIAVVLATSWVLRSEEKAILLDRLKGALRSGGGE